MHWGGGVSYTFEASATHQSYLLRRAAILEHRSLIHMVVVLTQNPEWAYPLPLKALSVVPCVSLCSVNNAVVMITV